MAADPESYRCNNLGSSRIRRGEVREMGRYHNDHRRSNLPGPAVRIAPRLAAIEGNN